ncbi:MAG TPA: dihydropteroate synthase-like protein [Methanoculleus sp.]|nr:dihydropteroate synthase-like protein [Methanoculleus sp.]
MRILLPTGKKTASIVQRAAGVYDADVVVTGEIASFLTPSQLASLLKRGEYDLAITSGMCTADFREVEAASGVPVYRGPRHAADLPLMLRLLSAMEFSRTVPADEFLALRRRQKAAGQLRRQEEGAACAYRIRGLKIGGSSRIKVLAEIMDAHRQEHLAREVERYFSMGADIVDLGFGFDATAEDVRRCMEALSAVEGPLAIDTQDPDLIRAGLGRADLVLSLHDGNLPLVGDAVAAADTAAVIVPRQRSLAETIEAARTLGIRRILADPLLQPVGSGLAASLAGFSGIDEPAFFGAGNVTELIDADSPGVNALLAGMAHECGAAVIFTSEHSDKTRGSVAEMRRAVEMMALMGDRPYPKDLGLDLLVIKEKRKRRPPPLDYDAKTDAEPARGEMEYDPKGNVRIGIEDGMIVAVHDAVAIRGACWEDVFSTLLREGRLSLLDHAAYLGKELYKAELSLRFGRSYDQDGVF